MLLADQKFNIIWTIIFFFQKEKLIIELNLNYFNEKNNVAQQINKILSD